MRPETKKLLNRGGVVIAAVGVVIVLIAGGDPDAAMATIGKVAAVAGTLLVAIRELFS